MGNLALELGRFYRNKRYEISPNGILFPTQQLMVNGVFAHEHIRNGKSLGLCIDPNVYTNEGLNYVLSAAFGGGTQHAIFYLGIFKGNYTPVSTDTAANIASNSTESTEYDNATRPQWQHGGASSQLITNSGNRTEFVANATVSWYGVFLISNNAKQGTSGVMASGSRFSQVRNMVAGDSLLVNYGLQAQNA